MPGRCLTVTGLPVSSTVPHGREHILIDGAEGPELAELIRVADDHLDLVRVARDGHPEVDVAGEGSEARQADQRFLDGIEFGVVHVVVVAGQEAVMRVGLEHVFERPRGDDAAAEVAIHHHGGHAGDVAEFLLNLLRGVGHLLCHWFSRASCRMDCRTRFQASASSFEKSLRVCAVAAVISESVHS